MQEIANKIKDLKYEDILDTLEAVRDQKPITYEHIGSGSWNSSEDEGSIDGIFGKIIERAIEGMLTEIASYNGELAEIQEVMKEQKVIETAQKTDDEQKNKIVDMVKRISVMSIEQQQVEQKGQKGLADRKGKEIKRIIDNESNDESITLLTRIFPTVLMYSGRGEAIVKINKKKLKNLASCIPSESK